MKASMRVMGYDTPAPETIEIALPEGADIMSALAEYLRVTNLALSLDELSRSQFLVNGKACPPGIVLEDGDRVTVLRLLGGG